MASAVLAVGMSVLLGWLVSVVNLDVRTAVILSLAAVLLTPLVWRWARGTFDLFEPVVAFGVVWALFFLVRPLAMLGEPLVYVRDENPINIESTFTFTLVLALIGAFGFMVGYHMRLGSGLAKRLPKPPQDLDTYRVVMAALFVAGISLVMTAVFLVASGVDFSSIVSGRSLDLTDAIRGSSSYLWLASLAIAPASVALLVAGVEKRSGIALALGVISAALFLVRVIPQGNRIYLMPFVAALLAYWYLRRARRPSVAAVMTMMAVGLVLWTVLLQTRSDGQYGQEEINLESLRSDPGQLVVPFTEGPDNEMMPALAAALQPVPDRFAFRYGAATVGDFVTRPIPRAVWADKPLPPREEITLHFWPREYEAGAANVEYSVLLYLFWDAWVPGVFLGMLLFGVAARMLYQYYRLYERNFVAHVMLGFGLALVVLVSRDSPVDNFVRFMFFIFPAILIFFVGARSRSPTQR